MSQVGAHYAFVLHDTVNPSDPLGRTFKQINEAKPHTIPIGSLVELETGERLLVADYNRDCDGKPLYILGVQYQPKETWLYGYSESSLTVVTK